MTEQGSCGDLRTRVKKIPLDSEDTSLAFESNVANAQSEPILKVKELLDRDLLERPEISPILLSIGEIRDPNIKHEHVPWKPKTVIDTEEELSGVGRYRSYLLPPGNEEYLRLLAQYWTFGTQCWTELGGNGSNRKPAGMIWAQTTGGTNALRFALNISRMQLDKGERILAIESPGWPIYRVIAKESRYEELIEIDRRNPDGSWYDHLLFIEALKDLPVKAVILMQSSGFNGDGVDKTPEQWDEIASIVGNRNKKHTVILDLAYSGLVNGFGSGKDNYAVKRLAKEEGIDLHIAVSNSKNLGMYSSRLGAWYYLLRRTESNDLGSLDRSERMQNYINTEFLMGWQFVPPRLSSEVATFILKDQLLRNKVEQEIEEVRCKFIKHNRKAFINVFQEKFPWIRKSQGIFVTLLTEGFSPEVVEVLRMKHGYYCPPSSRINITGIPEYRVSEVAENIKAFL